MAALDYTNVYFNYILEQFVELLGIEFKEIDVVFSKHTGTESFLITLDQDNLENLAARAQGRIYTIALQYQYVTGVFDMQVAKKLSNIAERVKRLIDNYRDFSVEAAWVSAEGTWGNTTHKWNEDINTYCWNNGVITDINYNQADVEPGQAIVDMNFSCFRQEIIR